MKSRFIRSALKTRPDPAYYLAAIERLERRRYERLWPQIEALEAETGQEARDLRRKEADCARRQHGAMMQLCIAMRIVRGQVF